MIGCHALLRLYIKESNLKMRCLIEQNTITKKKQIFLSQYITVLTEHVCIGKKKLKLCSDHFTYWG